MKEQLIELLKSTPDISMSDMASEMLANRLIANEVVLPPCRLGDMVRRADGVWTVWGFDCNRGGKWTVKLERWKDQFQDCHEYARAPFYAFGKTVFLVGKPPKPLKNKQPRP